MRYDAISFKNEKAALSSCLFEEFSYENVNLSKGIWLMQIGYGVPTHFLLIRTVYPENMSEL